MVWARPLLQQYNRQANKQRASESAKKYTLVTHARDTYAAGLAVWQRTNPPQTKGTWSSLLRGAAHDNNCPPPLPPLHTPASPHQPPQSHTHGRFHTTQHTHVIFCGPQRIHNRLHPHVALLPRVAPQHPRAPRLAVVAGCTAGAGRSRSNRKKRENRAGAG